MSSSVFSKTTRILTLQLAYRNLCSKRLILTPAYKCQEEWNKRLDEPLIKDIELESYFYQLTEKLSQKTSITPSDVDFYVNKASKANLMELENIIKQFRKNWRSFEMLDSTRHAFIRILIDSGNYEKLINIIHQRVEFGMFPDKFCYNMALDAMIEAKQWRNAAQLAALRMLQEDFDSQIGNYLSLKAIDTYMIESESLSENLFVDDSTAKNDNEDQNNEDQNDEDEDDEVEFIRIPFLRNKFFDDHFDLKETYSLLGKTFWLVGNAIRNEHTELSKNCVLFGLIIYKKWDKAFDLLNKESKNINLAKDLVERVEKFVSTLKKSDSSNEQSEESQEGEETKNEETSVDLKSSANELDFEKGSNILSQLKSISNVSTKTMNQLIDDTLLTIGKLETNEINELKTNYEKFRNKREEQMKASLDHLLRLEIIDKIKEKRKEFKKREEKLYFFENIERLKLLEHEAAERIRIAEQSMKIEEEYIPPRTRR